MQIYPFILWSMACNSNLRASLFILPLTGLQKVLRRRRVCERVCFSRDLQSQYVSLGTESKGEVRLWSHMRQNLSRASAKGCRGGGLCSPMPARQGGKRPRPMQRLITCPMIREDKEAFHNSIFREHFSSPYHPSHLHLTFYILCLSADLRNKVTAGSSALMS
jgi:hypothetical protein